jgi:ABC-type proline/glycine betaine transport system permease subunit
MVGHRARKKVEKTVRRTQRRYALVAERVHDLSRSPGDAQREAMWNVEVPEAFKALEAAHDGGG